MLHAPRQTGKTTFLAQHTKETGQVFEPLAVEAIWYWSQGQPYLVNALAKQCVWTITNEDFTRPITAEMILEAKEDLIQACTTHLDALAERLKTPDVKKVIEAIITGEVDPTLAQGREFELCLDLGLVALENGVPIIANPLYREVFPRVLNYGTSAATPAGRQLSWDERLRWDAPQSTGGTVAVVGL